jgi:uncharacterized protein (TIRG00374 family)
LDILLALPANFARQFLIVAVLTIGLLGAMAAFSDVSEVWASIQSLGWLGWAFILGLSLINYLLRYIRWDFYLRRLGYRVPFVANLSIYLAGFGFTTTPGKVGEVVRTVYLKPYGVRYIHGLSAFFVERLVDMISMIIVASLAAYAFESMRWLVVLTFVVTVALLPMVHSESVYKFLERRRQGFKALRIRSMGEHLLSLLSSSADLLRSGPLYVGLALGLLAWAAEGYGLYFVLERLGATTPLYLAAGIYGVSVLAGVVSFVPGGLGGTELVMGSLLILTGVDSPIAVSAVIICRLATLWFAVAIGLAFVVGIEVGGLAKKMPLKQGAGTAGSGE